MIIDPYFRVKTDSGRTPDGIVSWPQSVRYELQKEKIETRE